MTTPEASREVFAILETIQPTDKKTTGRPGLDLWQILVLYTVRISLNCEYDRLPYVANTDSLMRQLLGQPAFDMTLVFSLIALKENLALPTEQLLISCLGRRKPP